MKKLVFLVLLSVTPFSLGADLETLEKIRICVESFESNEYITEQNIAEEKFENMNDEDSILDRTIIAMKCSSQCLGKPSKVHKQTYNDLNEPSSRLPELLIEYRKKMLNYCEKRCSRRCNGSFCRPIYGKR